MPAPVIVTDRDTLASTVEAVVRRVMLDTIPAAVREASAPEWMGRDEVCDRYGLTPRQLTYMREKNCVEFTQHGRRILYNRASIEEWIDAGRVRTNGNS